MKNKLLPKYLLIGLIAFSLFSFLYVNMHAAYTTQACAKEQLKAQPAMVEDDQEAKPQIPVPDVAILSRIADIVQKFTLNNR